MSEHDLEKLLGGFAADTLTPEERRLLYAAALQDQQLFNALADEQALKELLADPAVRRRLLQALNQARATSGGSWSWLEWFRRPAGLAYAGGLAAAALAVVLGTRIYQDSLKQAAQSVATEDSKSATPPASQPAQPQVNEPQPKTKENAEPAKASARKDALTDKMVKREQAAPSKPQEQPTSDPAHDNVMQRNEQDDGRRQSGAPIAALGKAAEEVTTSPDQKLAAGSAPSPAAPTQLPRALNAPAAPQTSEAKSLEPTAVAPLAGVVGPGIKARALFYKHSPLSAEEEHHTSMAQDIKPGSGAMAEAPQREKKRADRSAGLLGKLDRPKPSVEMPLGIRYSLIMKGPGGIDMEVDPTTAVGKDDSPRLAIQANEEGYLTVFSRRSADTPTVLFPSTGDGHIQKLTNVAIALASLFTEQPTAERVHLSVWFSRTPHDTRNAMQAAKNAPRLLIEQVDPGQPGMPPEQAVYVVNPDPAPAATVSVEVPLSLRP